MNFLEIPHKSAALAELDLVAAFFLVGRKAERHTRIVREILDRGHEIRNHSYDHNGYRVEPLRDLLSQKEQANRVLERFVGVIVKSCVRRIKRRSVFPLYH